MATVIVAPEQYVYPDWEHDHKVFLAGAIDMGKAVDWQSWVIKRLKDEPHIALFNPRRATAFTPEMETEQILWEIKFLELVDTIFMWYPAESKAPISILETGLYLKSGKLLLGVEDGWHKKRTLEVYADHTGTSFYHDLPSMIEALLEKLGQ